VGAFELRKSGGAWPRYSVDLESGSEKNIFFSFPLTHHFVILH
jgi:hypothetical protein